MSVSEQVPTCPQQDVNDGHWARVKGRHGLVDAPRGPEELGCVYIGRANQSNYVAELLPRETAKLVLPFPNSWKATAGATSWRDQTF